MPYGFPSGAELVGIVHDALRLVTPVDPLDSLTFRGGRRSEPWKQGVPEYDREFRVVNPLVSMLLDLGYSEHIINDFRKSLLMSQLNSVDAFLELRSDFVDIGKACIAYELLMVEREDTLFLRDNHWYKYLWNQMSCPVDKFQQNQLTVVTYNYDRSLEYYLFKTICNTFGLPEEKAWDLLKSIRFIHLHGKLGSLPYESNGYVVNYGKLLKEPRHLEMAAKSIIVIHEGQDESSEYKDAFDAISRAERVYSLGFGYGKTNLRRLGIDRLKGSIVIMGTCVGMSNLSISAIQSSTRNRIKLIHSEGCLDFLREVPLD